ncbi:6-phosphogluconate dehydrogenase C-terminal domain-like protein [Suillus decipiens]|nr:6-phosphogluconate dehydrogenase C-terminal domain-like protein [Suillus decipiens]
MDEFYNTRVTFYTAGNLSLSQAVHIGKQGYGVTICVPEGHPGAWDDINRTDLRATLQKYRGVFAQAFLDGSIDLTDLNTIEGTGEIEGIVKVDLVDIRYAVESSRIIINTSPAGPAQAAFLNAVKPYDLSKHIVIGEPGNMLLLNARLILNREKFPKHIVETASSPFATRRDGATVHTSGVKTYMEIATTSTGTALKEVMEKVTPLFPPQLKLEWISLGKLTLNLINPWIHLAAILAGRPDIDAGATGKRFYFDWVPLAGERIERLDRMVRLPLATACGIKVTTVIETANEGYNFSFKNWTDVGRNSPVHRNIAAPTTKEHRYVLEEVQLMDFFRSWATAMGVDATPIDELIAEAEEWLGRSLVTKGAFWSKLGLHEASREKILVTINGADIAPLAPFEKGTRNLWMTDEMPSSLLNGGFMKHTVLDGI